MLETVTARLRPRSPWESQDLGLALVRREWLRLVGFWALTIFPLWAVLAVSMRHHPGWFFLVTWWLKPVYDRVPLFCLSRTLFGQTTRLRDVLRAWPRMLFLGNLHYLTIGRFSFWRSFTMPAKVLERPKYTTFRRRASTLLQHGGAAAFWVTTTFLVAGILAVCSLFMLVESLASRLVEEPLGHIFRSLFMVTDYQMADFTWWLLNAFHLAGITCLEPFYVGAGFGIYLNSRTHLEGWDIEIALRSLGERMTKAASVSALALVLLGAQMADAKTPAPRAAPTPSLEAEISEAIHSAQPTPTDSVGQEVSSPKEAIQQIKSSPDFKVHKKDIRVPQVSGAPQIPSGWSGFSFFGNLLYISVLVLAGAMLCWLIYINRHMFRGFRRSARVAEEPPSQARTVMGLDVSPEALPADIPKAAWERWITGDAHGAMRLLYAGSLSWLIQRGGLPVQESDTERDCLRHAAALPDPSQISYFNSLTGAWVTTAYGKQTPPAAVVESLVQRWPFHLQRRSA